jgi:pilus assembly protein CpaE
MEKFRPAYSEAAELYCFLPAKPGVGTSVVAVNSSFVLSRISNKRVLLCDLDFHLSMASFFLKLQPSHSIIDAMQYAGKLDEDLWQHFVDTRGKLDITGTGGLGPAREPKAEALQEVLRFARRLYGTVAVDLSGNMETWSLELLEQATQIFLVATHEIPALHLARMKADALRELKVQDRVSVLLNRTERRQSLSVIEIEKIIGFPVRASFQNDYKGVNNATLNGLEVAPDTDLGREFTTFAAGLAGTSAVAEVSPAPRRKFLEFFAVTPSAFNVERPRV